MSSNHSLNKKQRGRVIAFASAKGGTGKTVLAASTAFTLLRSGKRVLVIDSDFSTRGLSLFILGNILNTSDLDVKDEECLAEYFLREIQLDSIRPRQIQRYEVEYHVLFSNKTLWQSGVPEQAILSAAKLDPRQYIVGMTQLLDKFRNDYDYIIVDTRGGYDFTSAGPALLADTYTIVLESDRVSLAQVGGFEKAMATFAENFGLRIPLRGFIVNKAAFDPEDTVFTEQLVRTYGIKTYGIIPADINCILAYQNQETPITRFPNSDFAFWSIRAIENLIGPRINWDDVSNIEKFDEIRAKVIRQWAARKRLDIIKTWLPFTQLAILAGAVPFYISYRYSFSNIGLIGAYTLVTLFIIWSMIVSTLTGIKWLQWRGKSSIIRVVSFTAAWLTIVVAASVMMFDVPRHVFFTKFPRQTLALGRSVSEAASAQQQQALDVVNAWTKLALATINNSQGRIYSEVENHIASTTKPTAQNQTPDSTGKLVFNFTTQITDAARLRVQTASNAAVDAIKSQADQTMSISKAVVSVLENPRTALVNQTSVSEPKVPRELSFPSVQDILNEELQRILNGGANSTAPR